ncbi:MAG: hypothetical protein HOV78_11580 [Hamadaea sp.]|nr:hypothetical protein [Hamadaea sp.]
MRNPGRTWGVIVTATTLGIGGLDVWCDRRKDDSTLSCCTRRLVARVPGGRHLFAAGLAVAAIGFYDHIVGPLAAAVQEHS